MMNLLITEETYLEMKRLIANYESKQLNKHTVISCVEQPYLETITVSVETKIRYNPEFGDDKVCKCGHPYYRHFDSYENMEVVGCKYCQCFYFEQ